MKNFTNYGARIRRAFIPILLITAASVPVLASPAADACKQIAGALLQSCKREAPADFWLAAARCRNLPTQQERATCLALASEELADALELCSDQHEERIDVCGDLGGGLYAPIVNPANFVDGVHHPYFPLQLGVMLVYDEYTDRGVERVEVTPTGKQKVILGVTCVEVRDLVTLRGEPIEDTLDWFAQDVWGNVWYFGELSMNFEDGELVDLGGSWRAGVDGALPGIVMKAAPRVGDVYRQEFLIGEAEDIAEVFSLTETAVVPFGTFTNCVQTEDQTPIEPDIEEFKYYAAGVGFVLSVNAKTGNRTELVDIVQK
jgi:hypothetical protein